MALDDCDGHNVEDAVRVIEVMTDVEFPTGAEQSSPSVRTPHNSGPECL